MAKTKDFAFIKGFMAIFRYLIPFSVTLGVALIFARVGLDIHHDGIVWKAALDVASGQTLFKDTFTQYGALSVELQALAIRWLGPSLYSIKVMAAFFYALSAVGLCFFWSQLMPMSWSLLIWGLWLMLAPYFQPQTIFLSWASVFALFFQVCAAGCALKAIQSRVSASNRLYFIMAGALAGLTFWCRFPVGAMLAMALIGSLVFLRNWRAAGFVALGLSAVMMIFILRLKIAGALPYWFEQNFIWPAEWAKQSRGMSLERIAHHLLRLRNQSLVVFFGILITRMIFKKSHTAWALLWGVALFWRFPLETYLSGVYTAIPLLIGVFLFQQRKTAYFEPLFVASAVSLASWSQFYPVNDERHVYWALSPMLGVFIFGLYSWVHLRAQVLWTFVAIWALSIAATQLPQAHKKLTQAQVPSTYPQLRGILLPAETEAAFLPLFWRIQELKLQQGTRPIVLESMDAFYAAFTEDLRNAHRVPVVWGMSILPSTQFDEQGLQFIQETRPWIVLAKTGLTQLPPHPVFKNYRMQVTILDPDRHEPVSLWAEHP